MGDDLDAELAAFEAEVDSLGPVTSQTLQKLKQDGTGTGTGSSPPGSSSLASTPPVGNSKRLHPDAQRKEPESKRAKVEVVAGAEPTLNKEYLRSIVNSYRHEDATATAQSTSSTAGVGSSSSASGFVDYNHPGLPTTLTASENQDYQSQQSVYNYDPRKIREREENRVQGKEEEASVESKQKASGEGRKFIREVGDKVWEDKSLAQWPENDYRIFVGNLGKEITSEALGKPFKEFKSYNMSRVVQNKANRQSRGYGFVSFGDPHDMLRALREKQGKYLGHRPMLIKRSKWQERDIRNARARKKQEKRNKRTY